MIYHIFASSNLIKAYINIYLYNFRVRDFIYDIYNTIRMIVGQSNPSWPVIVIVENDDFKVDTTTGSRTGAHRKNVMFVQPESYEKKSNEEPAPRLTKKKGISAKLKQKCEELTQVHQYICPPGSMSEPPAHPRVDPPVNGTGPQHARSVIHALSHADNTRPPPHE